MQHINIFIHFDKLSFILQDSSQANGSPDGKGRQSPIDTKYVKLFQRNLNQHGEN